MARDGQGNYIPPLNNWNPAVDGNEADADGWNQLLQDLSTALSQSLSSDGQTSMTGPLRMGGNRIQDLGEPTGNSHAVRRSQLGKGGNLASANNVDIPNEGALFEVTGTTDIKSLSGGFNGRLVVLRFLGSLTIEHSDNLALPNQSDITTKAGDAFVFYRFSGDKWAALYGASATRDVVSSNTDTSGGNKVVTQGWMGLGQRISDGSLDDLNGLDMNNLPNHINTAGFHGHTTGNAAANAPTPNGHAYLFLKELSNSNFQIAMRRGGNNYYMRTDQNPWDELHHTGNFPPIGMCYTQYPGTDTPSTLFGGTWTLMFNTEGVFFRTEGQGASSFGGGVQGDAIRNISGIFSAYSYEDGGPSGPFRSTISNTSQLGADNPIETRTYIRFSFNASREVPTASENRPRNRTVRVWRKTAH